MRSGSKYIILCGLVLFCSSCATTETPTHKDASERVRCSDPRPQICTREYMPVCATRDTGVRCVTTPCHSTEEVTYSTGCTACSDPKVSHYRTGKCEK